MAFSGRATLFSIDGYWRRFDLTNLIMPELCFSVCYRRRLRIPSRAAKKIESSTHSVLEAVERLMRGLTTFIIGHRLSALKHTLIRIVHGRLHGPGANPNRRRREGPTPLDGDRLREGKQCSRPH